MDDASQMIDISVVVPVYNGADALAELCERVARTAQGAGLRHEVILVDDRGRSDAWQVIQSLASAREDVVGVRLSKNFGQHAATICGIDHARGRWIVTLDDDLEHPPEAIPAMLAAGSPEHPLVYGVFRQRTHSLYRNLSSAFMRRLLKRAFPDMNRDYCSFRAIHAPLAKQLIQFQLNKPYIDGMLSWLTASTRSVTVEHLHRKHGASGYTLPKLISHAVNIFVTFSTLPLRAATYSGAVLSFVSFLYLIYVMYGKLSGHITNPGYSSLMSVILLACGVQLLILGVVGEYVARLMGTSYRRPVYYTEDLIRQDEMKTARGFNAEGHHRIGDG